MIYKYYPCNENTLSCLREKYLWLSKLSEFNDPYDSDYKRLPSEKDDYQKSIPELSSTDIDAHIEMMNDFCEETHERVKQNTFITCFTIRENNTLMWDRYADSHKGICIGYNVKNNQFSDNEVEIIMKCVNYNPEVPEIKNSDFKSVSNFYFRKDQGWEDEEEIRLVRFPGKVTELPEKADKGIKFTFWNKLLEMKKVYFGLNCSDENKNNIKSILGNTVSYFKCTKTDNHDLGFEEETF